jgi:predicted aspartyl protease
MINEKIVPILIDTGATWSHVSKEICDNFEKLSEPRTVLKFDGSLKIMSQSTIVRLKLREIEEFQLKILVDEQPNKYLFGIDFLKQFDYSINFMKKLSSLF